MRFITLLLSLFLGLTASAAPLLVRRQGVYTIDGEPTTFHVDHNKDGRIIPPADFPHYDSIDLQCEAHKNYVPRISINKWEQECPPKILQWKIDHNVFESRELAARGKAIVERRRQKKEQEAAEAKANEEQKRHIEKEKLKNMLRDCETTPEGFWCRTLLQKDSEMKK